MAELDLDALKREWRPVPGFEGYSVSDDGLIRAERPPRRGSLLKLNSDLAAAPGEEGL